MRIPGRSVATAAAGTPARGKYLFPFENFGDLRETGTSRVMDHALDGGGAMRFILTPSLHPGTNAVSLLQAGCSKNTGRKRWNDLGPQLRHDPSSGGPGWLFSLDVCGFCFMLCTHS